MSFGWSAGDVIAGLKVVWDIWEAVSDGPLNAKYQASQFFDEFYHIISRLDDWEKRKAACAKDDRLVRSHRELRDACTVFIKKHFALIQESNPGTKSSRTGRSTWLQKASFTRGQILTLYQQVQWPMQREHVGRLREKLQFFLNLAAWDVALDTNDIVRDIRTTNSELIATNYKLVTSHLDLVASITTNLKRVTYPLEPGRQPQEIDYPMLRQFERALRPPQPIHGLLEDTPRQLELPWSPRRQHDEAEYATIAATNPQGRELGSFGHEEVRGLISQRLDNLSMRVKRTDTLETITENGLQETAGPSTQQLLDRLRDIRAQIGDAVGILNHVPQNEMALVTTEPGIALKKELEAWDTMKQRIEREILHPPPPPRRVWAVEPTSPRESVSSASTSRPLPIPMAIPTRRTSGTLSPPISYDGWSAPNGSPSRSSGSLSSSPKDARRLSSHSRSDSTSSISRRPFIRSDHEFQVHLYYPKHAVHAVIRGISRNDDGEVQTISSYSTDGITRYRHSVDYDNVDPRIETSMIPFVDNRHVAEGHPEQTPRYRVQFKGTHNLKILVRTEHKNEVTIGAHPCPPMYKFLNESDFLEFQRLLLNKDIKHHADVLSIKSLASDVLCRVGTIRITFEPFSRTKHIIYFQHLNLASDQRAGFVEWPVSIFKEPKEPVKKSKTLTLESQDGKTLFSQKGLGLARRATQGSVNTIASNETASPAFLRMQERSSSSSGKSIRGLVVEFYDTSACHRFWEEFTRKEPTPFQQGGLGLNIDPGFSVSMPGSGP